MLEAFIIAASEPVYLPGAEHALKGWMNA
ncbi:hypothetical protein MPLA_1060008 [Mesorhizobium sp. ORS 3359]|nr:hypothetical protein MPLA_1060008 [Mesorhizobium sp. ORS 3359]